MTRTPSPLWALRKPNPSEGRISNESPLGRALLGHKKGEEVNVKAPDGDYQVKIVKVS